MPPLHIDWAINVGSLASLLVVVAGGLRVLRVLHNIEFRVEMMWADYQRRIEGTLRTRAADIGEAHDDSV